MHEHLPATLPGLRPRRRLPAENGIGPISRETE
jgi:hypothetical protein